jgi:hypothetical protein
MELINQLLFHGQRSILKDLKLYHYNPTKFSIFSHFSTYNIRHTLLWSIPKVNSLEAYPKKCIVDEYQNEHQLMCRVWAMTFSHFVFNNLQKEIKEFWKNGIVVGFLA